MTYGKLTQIVELLSQMVRKSGATLRSILESYSRFFDTICESLPWLVVAFLVLEFTEKASNPLTALSIKGHRSPDLNNQRVSDYLRRLNEGN